MRLSPALAASPDRSLGRAHRVKDDGPRGPRDIFQRDRDRIIHSVAFRRLRHKTQVFIAPDGDHYRVRLTHSLEVAQIGRAIARALGLNEDLTEALCLAHDLGHPPFGHAGEEALQDALRDAGGFDHNAHSIRLVTKLEQSYHEFEGLNLSWECLEGLAKHNGPIADPTWALVEANAQFDLRLDSWPGLEAQVAAIADDIAYDNHDIDDGLRAGLLDLDRLLEVPIVRRNWQAIESRHPSIPADRKQRALVRDQIGVMVADVLGETARRIRDSGVETLDEVRRAGRALVGFSADLGKEERTLKSFLYEHLYDAPQLRPVRIEAQRIIADLAQCFRDDDSSLPDEWRREWQSETHRLRTIGDFIAGMTDRYAMRMHERLVGRDSLPGLF